MSKTTPSVEREAFSPTDDLQTAQREANEDFIARALRSLDDARRLSAYVDADIVINRVQDKLNAAIAKARARHP